MSKAFAFFILTVLASLYIVLIELNYENNRLDQILAKYSEIESRAIYVSGCIYGGGSFETCTNAYYSVFVPRMSK